MPFDASCAAADRSGSDGVARDRVGKAARGSALFSRSCDTHWACPFFSTTFVAVPVEAAGAPNSAVEIEVDGTFTGGQGVHYNPLTLTCGCLPEGPRAGGDVSWSRGCHNRWRGNVDPPDATCTYHPNSAPSRSTRKRHSLEPEPRRCPLATHRRHLCVDVWRLHDDPVGPVCAGHRRTRSNH